MARGELLSVLGLYQWDNTIFDEFVFPSEITKETLINNILIDCAELEVLYSNPNVLKSAIGFWSQSRIKAWNDMKNVLIVEDYRPFINLERKESGYDLETRDLNSSSSGTSTSSGTDGTNTINKISAFNSSNFENKDSSESSSSSTSNGSTSSNIDDTGTIRKDYEHNFEGDSAMFTKQNIIEQEMEMRLKYDLYKIIIDEFKKKFSLLIY